MRKDKTKEIPTPADPESRGDLKQFKIYLHENDIEALKKYSVKIGVGHTTAARQILIEFLSKL